MSAAPIVTSRKSRKLVLSPRSAGQNALLLRELDEQFPVRLIDGYSSLVNYAPLADEPVHRWFPYREGYSTRLVSEVLSEEKGIETILDPFCGCGTTLVAAQNLGFHSVGLDVNPLAVLVTKAKTQVYSKQDVKSLRTYADKIAELPRSNQVEEKPALRIIDTVFHPGILNSLLTVDLFIKRIRNEKHREFLFTAWLAILEDVSNVYKEGNGIKYRNRKRTPTGYFEIPLSKWQASVFPPDKHAFVKEKLRLQLLVMIQDAESRVGVKCEAARVIEGSAMQMERIADASVDLSIFSPPYCNCFNYFKAFKIELWMGGFVHSYADMRALNSRAMRSHVETKLKRAGDSQFEMLERFVSLIEPSQLWDKRIPDAVRGYFSDMQCVLVNLRRVLKPGGRCVIVVGNSAYGGILIPTDSLLAQLGASLGFGVEQIGVARHLTTSSQQKFALDDRRTYLRESLVVLRKSR